jgi:hypothetical protein
MDSLKLLWDLDSLRYALDCVADSEILFYMLAAVVVGWMVTSEWFSGVHHRGTF